MRDLLSWNLYLGRWCGVQIRLHAFFLLLAILAIPAGPLGPDESGWYGLIALALLLASVLWHEVGHCLAARHFGLPPDQVLLWPLGGLTAVGASQDPQREAKVALAGPFANLLVCAALAPMLLVTDNADLIRFSLPPTEADATLSWPLTVALAFWLNGMLVVVNLLPAMPLDGGRALRGLLWRRFDYRSAAMQLAWIARLTAVALVVAGWLLREEHPYLWIVFAIFALLIWFNARHEADKLGDNDPDEGFFGYDFSQGYTSLEQTYETIRRPRPGFLRQWLDHRRELKLRRQLEIESIEDQRVDAILARLHELGPQQLSPEEQALLERVSARYRNRRS